MTLHLNNETGRPLHLRCGLLEKACAAALQGKNAEIGVTLVTEDAIRKINYEYRGKDSVTDVLSFSAGTDPEGTILGDIFICADKAAAQAKEIGNTLEEELQFLVIHGTLHILGYDHENKDDEAIMLAKQKEICHLLQGETI